MSSRLLSLEWPFEGEICTSGSPRLWVTKDTYLMTSKALARVSLK